MGECFGITTWLRSAGSLDFRSLPEATSQRKTKTLVNKRRQEPGADPGLFLGGDALVSCSTSTPISHTVFFLQNTKCIRKPQVISGGGGAHPLHPPPRSAHGNFKATYEPRSALISIDFVQTPRPLINNTTTYEKLASDNGKRTTFLKWH